ncbi:MAG: tripartite tricarboxylate transporter substrate-binding protein [Burkholderiales bacterium]|nr:tripartite tricarboxylate transporter substrate-binding protein [Burkholderiales bacterium]
MSGRQYALAQRISGVALAVFLPVHFWALGRALEGEAALQSFLRWTEQPLVKASEWAIVLALAVHFFGGVRILMVEFLPWRDWLKNLGAVSVCAAPALGLLFALASGAHAQAWPQKPVKFIVPFPPGGATDVSARLLAQRLQEIWGQTIVIENRGGAAGGVGAAEAARAAPDGYTLFFPSGSVMTANQHIYPKLNYDPEKDFVPVTKVVMGPQVLVVPANSPYRTVKDLIDAAKAQPGKFTFGHAGIGSQVHLAAENFVNAAGIDAVQVPYKGEAPALTGLVAGETTFMLANVAAAVGHVNAGRLRALGVTSRTEFGALPGVPPIAKTLPGFENVGWFGIVAPAGTPREIVQKVYQDTKKALETTELKARFYVQGLIPVGNSPEEMAREMREESRLWARVVRERRIEVK